MNTDAAHRAWRPIVAAAAAAWFAFLAVDFWVHAVLLAGYWTRTAGDTWRTLEELFRLIPVGYLSFAIYCAALVWLLARLPADRLRVRHGAWWGAVAGLVFGAAFWLGAYSILRLPFSAVVSFTAWGALESAVAGAAACWVLGAGRRGRRVGAVALLAILLIVAGVIAQNVAGAVGR